MVIIMETMLGANPSKTRVTTPPHGFSSSLCVAEQVQEEEEEQEQVQEEAALSRDLLLPG